MWEPFIMSLILFVGISESRVRYPFYAMEQKPVISTESKAIPGRYKNSKFGLIKINTNFSPQSLEPYTKRIKYRRETFRWTPTPKMFRGSDSALGFFPNHLIVYNFG